MSAKILLTGKNGQVGGELARLLPEIGDVIAVDRQQLDLAHPDQIRRTIRDIRPQLIVNAAAYTPVDQAEEEESVARAINTDAPGVMAEEAKKIGAALVHYSTDYVFDGAKDTPYEETDPTNPLNAYGRTKLDGEHAIRQAAVPHLILRTQWVYGIRGKNFLLTILRLAAEREELRIVSDQFGAPTWSREIARATVNVLSQLLRPNAGAQPFERVSGVYNMTAAGQTNWHQFAVAILEDAVGRRRIRGCGAEAGSLYWFRGLFLSKRRTIRRRRGGQLTPCFPTGGWLKRSAFNYRSGALSSIPFWPSASRK